MNPNGEADQRYTFHIQGEVMKVATRYQLSWEGSKCQAGQRYTQHFKFTGC